MDQHALPGRRATTLALAVALALPALAQAQNTGAGTTAMSQVEVSASKLGDSSGSYTIGKARTATPLNLSQRDTPQSVSVITQQRIEDQGLLTITDVVNNVTGVSVNQYETHRGGFTARGFDIDNLQVDGVPTTWDAAWSAGEVLGSLAMYDRVEVVRGATGLMTGAGNPSAAINLARKRATSKQLAGSADLTLGRWDNRRASIDLSAPLNADGSVRGRVVAEYHQADSWVQAGETKDHTLFATVEADLGRATRLTVGLSQQKADPKGPMWGGLPYWYTDGSLTNWDRSKTSAADWTRWTTTYRQAYAELEHRFGNGWQARATFARGEREGDSHLLYLSGVPDRTTGLGMFSFSGSYLTTRNQNDFGLHLGGPVELAGRRHELAFGYLHASNRFNSDSRAATFPGGDPGVGNFNAWNPSAYPEPNWGPLSFYENSATTQQGLYAMGRFSLTEMLKLVVGARLTNYDKEGVGLYSPAYRLKHEREMTPYAGLVLDLNDSVSAYASYTDIFQPQNLKDFSGNLLDPIVGKSAEAGFKAELFDRRANASAAVFYIKQDKLGQVVDKIDRDGAGPLLPEDYYRAADGATSKGIEFDISGEITTGLNANLGYTIYRAEDAGGQDINSVYPRKLLRAFATYRLPGAWSKLSVGGGVNWEGRTWTRDPNAPAGSNGLIEQEDFALVNLMARYEFSRQLSAQLNVNNLSDKTYHGMFAAFGAITYGAPRNASLTLRYRF